MREHRSIFPHATFNKSKKMERSDKGANAPRRLFTAPAQASPGRETAVSDKHASTDQLIALKMNPT
jgi:hypothetical protein